MAENEVLDTGNPRHYRRWHRALEDAGLSSSEVADCLSEDFRLVLRKKLRGKPLYLVLQACAQDRNALQDAIASCKDRAMAKLVEQAYVIARSIDPRVIASKIAELLIDRLVDRANRHAFKHDHNADQVRHRALEHATSTKLQACMPEIVDLLTASLRGDPIPRARNVPKARPSAGSLVDRSLRQPVKKPLGNTPHA